MNAFARAQLTFPLTQRRLIQSFLIKQVILVLLVLRIPIIEIDDIKTLLRRK